MNVELNHTSAGWGERRRRMLAAAVGTLLASCAIYVAASGRRGVGTVELERVHHGLYERALRDIKDGEERAKSGGFMRAASAFLKAKDLWKASGEHGWQGIQGLADAAVDK